MPSTLPDPSGGLEVPSVVAYRLVEQHYEEVKGVWEERFEKAYGFWRGFLDDVVYAFLGCGDFEGGFARIICDSCRREYLVAFSCSRRGFCPSCAAKRAAIFGALLREEILEDVPHAMWTFCLPKMLRRYFLYDRSRRAIVLECQDGAS